MRLATTVAANDLLIPLTDDGDSTTPSGTSAALELLARLYQMTGKKEYAQSALQILSGVSGSIGQSPGVWSSAVAAVNRYPVPVATTADRKPQAVSEAELRGPPSTSSVVRARGNVRRAKDHDEIMVTVMVDKGYHVNANPATFDYLVPTVLSVDGVTDLRVIYPAAALIKPRFAPDGLKVYEGTITLKGIAPKEALASGKTIAASLKVQACDDQVCLPPATLPIAIERK